MDDALEQIIEALNDSADRKLDPDNPLTKIVQILNEHMNLLQYLEESSSNLEHEIITADSLLQKHNINYSN